MGIEWFLIEFDKGDSRGRIPAWARSAALSFNGEVFIPAIVAAGEMIVFLCAGCDGVRAILRGSGKRQHAYYPAKWIAAEFPKAKEIAERIERQVLEAAAE